MKGKWECQIKKTAASRSPERSLSLRMNDTNQQNSGEQFPMLKEE